MENKQVLNNFILRAYLKTILVTLYLPLLGTSKHTKDFSLSIFIQFKEGGRPSSHFHGPRAFVKN